MFCETEKFLTTRFLKSSTNLEKTHMRQSREKNLMNLRLSGEMFCCLLFFMQWLFMDFTFRRNRARGGSVSCCNSSLCISNQSTDDCSNCLGTHWFMGNRSWCSSLVVSQVIQSQQKVEGHFISVSNDCTSEQRNRVGSRPPSSSQVQRFKRRPA